MKIKVFKIRLNKKYLESDQNKLNNFIENHNYIKSYTHFIEGKIDCWTMIIHYQTRKIRTDDMM